LKLRRFFTKGQKLNLRNKRNSQYKNPKINFYLNFRSLVSPASAPKLSLLSTIGVNSGDNKLLVKQSYLLLTWFYYISTLNVGRNGRVSPKFFIKPKSRSQFTVTKAPIAHKTFSQEQYQFLYYTINMSFTTNLNLRGGFRVQLNDSLYLAQLMRNYVFLVETNLFFIQRTAFRFSVCDPSFFYVK